MQNLTPTRPKAEGRAELLSDREHEVLELIVAGLSNTEIGQKPNTTKTYVKGIMNKLVVSGGPLGRSLTIGCKPLLRLFVVA